MLYQNLHIEIDNGIAVITISREKALNALNSQTMLELRYFFGTEGPEMEGLKGVVLTGAGEKAFVAGADITEFRDLDAAQGAAFAKRGQDIFFLIERFSKPVIAAVNGFALGGGCELALACDFIVASENALFGLPEVGLGILPGMGGTQRLSRVVGKAIALELVCGGRQLTADEGQRLGLVNHVVAIDALIDKGLEVARNIARMGPVAVKLAKQVVQRGQDMELTNANAFEAEAFAVLCATADKHEGMAAFVEKRRPRFCGR